jgi:hypothetical protein
MVAGIKTLEILDRPGAYEYLEKITSRLIDGILEAGREAGHEVCGGHISGGSSASHLQAFWTDCTALAVHWWCALGAKCGCACATPRRHVRVLLCPGTHFVL